MSSHSKGEEGRRKEKGDKEIGWKGVDTRGLKRRRGRREETGEVSESLYSSGFIAK